jgi:hypothetical protein
MTVTAETARRDALATAVAVISSSAADFLDNGALVGLCLAGQLDKLGAAWGGHFFLRAAGRDAVSFSAAARPPVLVERRRRALCVGNIEADCACVDDGTRGAKRRCGASARARTQIFKRAGGRNFQSRNLHSLVLNVMRHLWSSAFSPDSFGFFRASVEVRAYAYRLLRAAKAFDAFLIITRSGPHSGRELYTSAL